MLYTLTAKEAVEKIRSGELSALDLAEACLDRIGKTDGHLQAWVHIDRDRVLAQAEEADRIRKSGRATGPLHGVPVGLKDIIDTAGQPTQRGTPIHEGRVPDADSAVVERLREAGAVILGKTVTTEFAFMNPAATHNPHDPDRGPGGSSAGSAAAVAAGQVPLAVGTQTNGSCIRPASFCGVYGFKPTHGLISRRGVLETSQNLDQIGVFARSLADTALLADSLMGYDRADAASILRPKPSAAAGLAQTPPVEPIFAWLELPFYDRLSPAAREGLAELRDFLGAQCEDVDVPPSLAGLVDAHMTVQSYEIARNLAPQAEAHWDKMSPQVQGLLEAGRAVDDGRYTDALNAMAEAKAFFNAFFADYDAILSPSAAGEAPAYGDGTGDPIFCTIWTFAGLPSLSLPLLRGEKDLPIGAQLVGAAEQDDRLFRTAGWMEARLGGAAVD